MKIVIALIIFSLIILFHEFGHFLLAKMNKVTVVEFSLGMGPRLLSVQKGETRYSLKLLPFGGSCMMLGEDEATQEPGSFASKSVWARISVIAAGPVFNFILAFLMSMIIVGSVGYDAVSYTHLDVYKRQDEAFPERNENWILDALWNGWCVCDSMHHCTHQKAKIHAGAAGRRADAGRDESLCRGWTDAAGAGRKSGGRT